MKDEGLERDDTSESKAMVVDHSGGKTTDRGD